MIILHVKISSCCHKSQDCHCYSYIIAQKVLSMIETPSVLPRKSSATFDNLRKMFGDIRQAFETILENLWKSSESGRKSSESRQKHRY